MVKPSLTKLFCRLGPFAMLIGCMVILSSDGGSGVGGPADQEGRSGWQPMTATRAGGYRQD